VKHSRQSVAVITGLAVFLPENGGLDDFWNHLLGSTAEISADTMKPPKSQSDAGPDSETVATRAVRVMDSALKDAGLTPEDLESSAPLDIFAAISTGDIGLLSAALQAKAPPSPSLAIRAFPHGVAAALSRQSRSVGRALTVSCAENSALEALVLASESVASGRRRMAVVVAAEPSAEFVGRVVVSARRTKGDVSTTAGDPARPSFSPATVSAVIEDFDHAVARGARAYAAIAGAGSACDPPGSPPGSGLAVAMAEALDGCGHPGEPINVVYTHGPEGNALDEMEKESLARTFAEDLPRLAVTSLKPLIGDALAASGLLNVAAACLSLRRGWVPLPPSDGRPLRMQANGILVNGHGLGGTNTSVILRRVSNQ